MLLDTKFGDVWVKDLTELVVFHDVPGEVTYLQEGHFVGMDGFSCPNTVPEFIDRYPDYARAYAYKLMHSLRGIQYDMETFDDVASELLLHLINLSPGRKQYKEGKRSYIECFDPIRQHGAKKGQFFNYINMVLRNRFSGYVYDKLTGDPALNGFQLEWSDSEDPTTSHQESSQVITVTQVGVNPEKSMICQMDAQTILKRVIGLVQPEDRVTVEKVLRAAMLYDKNTEIALALGMKKEEVGRTLKKVRKICEEEEVFA